MLHIMLLFYFDVLNVCSCYCSVFLLSCFNVVHFIEFLKHALQCTECIYYIKSRAELSLMTHYERPRMEGEKLFNSWVISTKRPQSLPYIFHDLHYLIEMWGGIGEGQELHSLWFYEGQILIHRPTFVV